LLQKLDDLCLQFARVVRRGKSEDAGELRKRGIRGKVRLHDGYNDLLFLKREFELVLHGRIHFRGDDRQDAIGAFYGRGNRKRTGKRRTSGPTLRDVHLNSVRRGESLQPPGQGLLGGIEAVCQKYAERHINRDSTLRSRTRPLRGKTIPGAFACGANRRRGECARKILTRRAWAGCGGGDGMLA